MKKSDDPYPEVIPADALRDYFWAMREEILTDNSLTSPYDAAAATDFAIACGKYRRRAFSYREPEMPFVTSFESTAHQRAVYFDEFRVAANALVSHVYDDPARIRFRYIDPVEHWTGVINDHEASPFKRPVSIRRRAETQLSYAKKRFSGSTRLTEIRQSEDQRSLLLDSRLLEERIEAGTTDVLAILFEGISNPETADRFSEVLSLRGLKKPSKKACRAALSYVHRGYIQAVRLRPIIQSMSDCGGDPQIPEPEIQIL